MDRMFYGASAFHQHLCTPPWVDAAKRSKMVHGGIFKNAPGQICWYTYNGKRIKSTDSGEWVQRQPRACATRCGGTPGAVVCTTSKCDSGTEPAPKQCPKTDDCSTITAATNPTIATTTTTTTPTTTISTTTTATTTTTTTTTTT